MNLKKYRKQIGIAIGCLCMLGSLLLSGLYIANAAAGSVTGYQKITWGISTGRYYVNGTHAFCAQYNKSWPTVGTEVERIEPCNNEVLRKALYYGYNGPKNTLGTDEKAHVLTAIAVSDANIGERETGASAKYDTFYWDLVNYPENYPSPPEEFQAYMAITASDALQNLAFYQMEEPKPGYVTATKVSKYPELSDGNAYYTLEGAKYDIYRSEALSSDTYVGTLLTNAAGQTNTLELTAGTYYAKESVAPKGYMKDEQVISFTVTSKDTTTLHFTDIPQVCPVSLLLKKVDADTGLNQPQGAGSLKGARFSVQYYAGAWRQGDSPKRSWIFETDELGQIRYQKEYLVSGDALYETLPLGTLVIWETEASEGYQLNETVYVRELLPEGIKETVVPEQVLTYDLLLCKKSTDKQCLEGAEFTLYADERCLEKIGQVVTDEEGMACFQALYPNVTYYLKETTTPTGYLPLEGAFEICEETVPENGVLEMEIINEPEPEPEPKPEQPQPEKSVTSESPKTGDVSQTERFWTIGWISFLIVVIMSCHNRMKCARMTE